MPLLTELMSVGRITYKDAAPTVLTSNTQWFLQNNCKSEPRLSAFRSIGRFAAERQISLHHDLPVD